MMPFLRPKREVHGSAACRHDDDYRGVRTVIHGARLASYTRATGRGDPSSRQAHDHLGITGYGSGTGTPVSQIPSGPQSSLLVGIKSRPGPARDADRYLDTHRSFSTGA